MKEIDMIHTNSSRSDIGFFLSMLYHKPHVVHLREFGDLDYECYPLNPLWVHIYNIYSSRFICVSKAIQEHWVNKGIKRDKTTVIYNGINHERVSVSHDDSKCKNPMKIVMSGGVMKSKGQYLAIEALGELPSEVKHNVTLDFIGHYWDSYKAQLDDMIIRNKLQQQVQFLGARDDVLQLLKNYHVGLMCSRAEGFGRVTAEYMFAGLGVVASDSGANSELITNMIDGLLFYKDDSRSLSKAIEYYFYHREMLIKHANAARIKARRMFTAELYAERVCKIYQQIIDFA